MKRPPISILLFFFFFLLTSCEDDKRYISLIDRVESILMTHPDSSRILLDSIAVPDNLSNKHLARWCMLYGEVADTLFTDLPYVQQLKRSDSYYKAHGTSLEQSRIGLYLGRAYLDDQDPEMAMKTYLYSLDIALESNHYNQAGYICSYMGDLYDFDSNYLSAVSKYKEAECYFRKAGNLRSAAFALRDVGRMYAFSDSLELALDVFLQADTIITVLNDSVAMASINNGLGNIYKMMDELDLAEMYLLRSIQQDSLSITSNSTSLSGVYIQKKEYDKARYCLRKAEIYSFSVDTRESVFYNYYLIEKAEGNIEKSLDYFERFYHITDSIKTLENRVNIIKNEKEYDYLNISLENVSLHSDKQIYFMLWLIFVIFFICLLFLYYYRTNKKNKKLYKQRFDILEKDNLLSRLKQDLQSKQNELCKYEKRQSEEEGKMSLQCKETQKEIDILKNKIEEQRYELLFSSSIFKKVIKLSKEIIPGRNKSPLSKRDWQSLYTKVDEVYPMLKSRLIDFGMTEGETDYCFLTFLMLDTSGESVLLNIMPDSVNKIRQRVRKKLDIVGENVDIRTCLLNCVLIY